MALVRLLLAQMDVHDAGAGVERGPGLARHLLRRHRHVVLLRIGQHAVQRAGNDGLVAHGSAFDCETRRIAEISFAIMRPASAGFLRPPAIVGAGATAAVDRQIARAGKDRARLQAVEAADRVAEMRGVGIADVLRQMREVDVLVGEMQQMPRALPGAERAEGNAGLFLEQMQEARRRTIRPRPRSLPPSPARRRIFRSAESRAPRADRVRAAAALRQDTGYRIRRW